MMFQLIHYLIILTLFQMKACFRSDTALYYLFILKYRAGKTKWKKQIS